MMFWKKKSTYKENVDYLLHPYSQDILGVQLLIEPYEQVFYSYGNVKFEQQGEAGVLKFDYSIIHPGKYEIEVLKNDEKFHTILGDILTKIIIDEAALNESTRKNNLKEFNSQ